MSNLAIPQHLVNDRTVPEWFQRRLESIDRALIVYWNPMRGRWIIDRCTSDTATLHTHSPECPRTNVKVVQDEAGDYMPLCEDVLQWFGRCDVGNQFVNAEDYVRHLRNIGEEYDAKLKRERREITRGFTRDNKRQLLQMYHLMQQHDLEVNQ